MRCVFYIVTGEPFQAIRRIDRVADQNEGLNGTLDALRPSRLRPLLVVLSGQRGGAGAGGSRRAGAPAGRTEGALAAAEATERRHLREGPPDGPRHRAPPDSRCARAEGLKPRA